MHVEYHRGDRDRDRGRHVSNWQGWHQRRHLHHLVRFFSFMRVFCKFLGGKKQGRQPIKIWNIAFASLYCLFQYQFVVPPTFTFYTLQVNGRKPQWTNIRGVLKAFPRANYVLLSVDPNIRGSANDVIAWKSAAQRVFFAWIRYSFAQAFRFSLKSDMEYCFWMKFWG